MERSFPEPDWKHFRIVRLLALERLSERIVNDIRRVADDTRSSHHDRYRTIFKLIDEEDDTIATLFDDLRRSTAFVKLMGIRQRKLLTDEEFAGFSEETRTKIESVLREYTPE